MSMSYGSVNARNGITKLHKLLKNLYFFFLVLKPLNKNETFMLKLQKKKNYNQDWLLFFSNITIRVGNAVTHRFKITKKNNFLPLISIHHIQKPIFKLI